MTTFLTRTGEAVRRAVLRPDLAQLDFTWLARAPWMSLLAGWGTLLVEIGSAVFVWPRLTQQWLALATVGLHAGIAVALGLWAFSAVMIVLTASAFLVSAEPARELTE
jgi:hypothetical protein